MDGGSNGTIVLLLMVCPACVDLSGAGACV